MADYTGQVNTQLTANIVTLNRVWLAFENITPPSYYAQSIHLKRNGIHYPGDDVVINFDKSVTADWEVKDYFGNTALTGTVAASSVNLGSNWDLGWYRLYLTGPDWHNQYGYSRGSTNFAVIPRDYRFPTLPGPSVPGYASGQISPVEMVTRGCLGLGIPRISINHINDPWNFSAGDSIQAATAFFALAHEWWFDAYPDPVRERPIWMNSANYPIVVDFCAPGSHSPEWAGWVHFFVKDPTKDGTQIYAKVENGSSSGWKVTIRYPDSSTIVETYDNLPDNSATAASTITASSNYVKAFGGWGDYPIGIPWGPTVIGDASRQGVIDWVENLYPAGVEYFEGPVNEPGWDPYWGDSGAWHHIMYLYQDAVKTGNANAKAIGMSPVILPYESNFLRGGGSGYTASASVAPYLDGLSFHDYNTQTQGVLAMARADIENFVDAVEAASATDKVLWQTEANHAETHKNFAVHFPRASRIPLMKIILWEQYGLPFERNPLWYDCFQGYWGYFAWMFNGDKSPNGWPILISTLVRETWGKLFHHRIDFGSISANHIFLGNVYGDATKGSVAVFLTDCGVAGAKVNFRVWGDVSNLTIVDAFGNESDLSVSPVISIPVLDVPTYIRLPVGVNLSVENVNDWGDGVNIAGAVSATASFEGGSHIAEIVDGLFPTHYNGTGTAGFAQSTNHLPDSVRIMFNQDVEVERVIAWAWNWQEYPALIDYDLQTWNGSSWTTRKTVDRSSTSFSFKHGSHPNNTASEMETFWDSQYIEDIALDTPVTCSGIRIYVRKLSFGVSPDVDMVRDEYGYDLSVDTAWPRAVPRPKLSFQDIAVISPSAITGGPGTPSNTKAPSIETLTPKMGTQLSCIPGRWSPLATWYTYQWQTSSDNSTWSDISGATSSFYIVTSEDTGNRVRCAVTAHTSSGASSPAYTSSLIANRKFIPIGSV